jgi:hypothetical protein
MDMSFRITFLKLYLCRGFGRNSNDDAFRAAYSKIGNIRGFLKAPVLCLTATASSKMRKQVMKSLYMSNPLVISKSPDKSDIKLIVCKVKLNEDLSTTFAWLLNESKEHKDRTTRTIIYCHSICVCGELYSIFDHEMGSGAKLEGGGGMGGGHPPKYESSGLAGQSKILNDRM